MESEKNNHATLSGAIIIAAALVAIAIIWTQKPGTAPAKTSATGVDTPSQGSNSIAEITAADHIFGNPAAPIKFVEYSDPSCPYCKIFNPVMERLMDDYGAKGQVAWVYRHFPLYKPDPNGNILHPNAGVQAEALECSAALGGNSAFWAYEKEWYAAFPEDGANRSAGADMKQILDIAKKVGLEAVSFNECLASGRFKAKIDQAYISSINAGINGTPYTVIIGPSDSKIIRAGADTYATLKTIVDTLLSAL
ncbi:MAG: thioredoxin domain-containing protein [Candidatus Paceibacterota bacterium]